MVDDNFKDMWVWSKLSAVKWADAWEERFYGNPNSVISEIKGGKSIRVEVYCDTEEDGEKIRKQFGGSIRELKKTNWVGMNAPKAEAILIRDRLVISQLEDEGEIENLKAKHPDRDVIVIPAEMAFGTGDHPTTATCLRRLVDCSREQEEPEWSFLDLGTGSGVLAIAARLLGAGEVQAFDFDAKAVEVATLNIERNGVSDIAMFEEDVFTWKNRKKFKVVAANLFATVLIESLPLMRKWIEDDGRLILSGILKEQWPDVKKAAEGSGFELLSDTQKGKWVTATFDVGKNTN